MDENIDPAVCLDSSFFLAYLLPDENNSAVQSFFDKFKKRPVRLIAPALLPFEVFNGLISAVLKHRIKLEVALELGKSFLKIPVELKEVDFLSMAGLAAKEKLSLYDAAYLYLSQKYRVKLLSLDKKLHKAAR